MRSGFATLFPPIRNVQNYGRGVIMWLLRFDEAEPYEQRKCDLLDIRTGSQPLTDINAIESPTRRRLRALPSAQNRA